MRASFEINENNNYIVIAYDRSLEVYASQFEK